MRTKDFTRKVPVSIIIDVKVNGQTLRALLDTGSMDDFISTTAVDQLKLQTEVLAKPLPLQLAVHGSRSKINCCVSVDFDYQDIRCKRRLDVANLDNYDMILGTPFIYQHKVMIGMNPSRVAVGSPEPVPIEGDVVVVVSAAATDLLQDQLEQLRDELKAEAADLCTDTAKTDLPPLRAVNHTIPLIDEDETYSWRPSKCPEAMKPLWTAKKQSYLKTGRWPATYTNGGG
ncbi:hypothetical protein K503DRAFT_794800 [Rhizopogon vinicolor AM-OR11-026]|uniref:Peptidase A2 domain-containing protein n=1 Tax=Rhizopogon vinicolor AM-OR11-026 TaxID=1314800 RepID=A0A1B7MHZ4_9AGAM|nr:hypothetical protein K503DRAFT_794800 [Rhizopogon vinicolor AM-OR11-026]